MASQMLTGSAAGGLGREEIKQILGPDKAELLHHTPIRDISLFVEPENVPPPTIKHVILTVSGKTGSGCMANAIVQMITNERIYSTPGISSTLTLSFDQEGTYVFRGAQVIIYKEVLETGVEHLHFTPLNREAQDGLTSLEPGRYRVSFIQSHPTLGAGAETKATGVSGRIALAFTDGAGTAAPAAANAAPAAAAVASHVEGE